LVLLRSPTRHKPARHREICQGLKSGYADGLHENFPLGQGGLSDQAAVDVAAYCSGQPRPGFPDKVKAWPNGGNPADAPD